MQHIIQKSTMYIELINNNVHTCNKTREHQSQREDLKSNQKQKIDCLQSNYF